MSWSAEPAYQAYYEWEMEHIYVIAKWWRKNYAEEMKKIRIHIGMCFVDWPGWGLRRSSDVQVQQQEIPTAFVASARGTSLLWENAFQHTIFSLFRRTDFRLVYMIKSKNSISKPLFVLYPLYPGRAKRAKEKIQNAVEEIELRKLFSTIQFNDINILLFGKHNQMVKRRGRFHCKQNFYDIFSIWLCS